jgi:hypothetical protein
MTLKRRKGVFGTQTMIVDAEERKRKKRAANATDMKVILKAEGGEKRYQLPLVSRLYLDRRFGIRRVPRIETRPVLTTTIIQIQPKRSVLDQARRVESTKSLERLQALIAIVLNRVLLPMDL